MCARYLYKEKVVFTITSSKSSRPCTKRALPANMLFRPFGVPKGSKFLREENLGILNQVCLFEGVFSAAIVGGYIVGVFVCNPFHSRD